MKRLFPALALALALPGFAQAAAWTVTDQTTKDECSACHMAYPPVLLPRASWDAILGDLSNHFGEDASLAPEKVATIKAYLDKVAPASARGMDNANPILRISDFPWFKNSHDWVRARAKSDPNIGTIANCAACHRGAEQGYFEDE
jgi:hypothetical protein